MNFTTTIKVLAATAALAIGGAAGAANVYCPGQTGGNATDDAAPASGRYVYVTGGALPGECYYTDGNLDRNIQVTPPPKPTIKKWYETVGAGDLEIIDKNGDPGTFLISAFIGDALSGDWELWDEIWDHFDKLYLGFHFGQGSGSPDSFIVQLEEDVTSGRWQFGAIAPASLNGLSNIYLLSNGPCEGDCGGEEVPEPGSLALLGAGLASLALVRRRRRF